MVETLKKAPKVSGQVELAKDVVLVPPESIEDVLQTRYNANNDQVANYGHTDEDIADLVRSFREIGQEQACIGRMIDGGKIQLLAGLGRWVAANLYNGRYPDEPMKLAVKIVKCSDEEAMIIGDAENRRRKATTPLDDAYVQDQFRKKFNWTNSKLAEHFGCDPAHVTRLQRILNAPEKVRAFVHTNLLPVQTAYEIAGLDTKSQNQVMAQIVKEGKDVIKRWKELDKYFKDEPDVQPPAADEAEETPPAKGGKKGGKKGTKKKAGKKTASRAATRALREHREQTNGTHTEGADAPPAAGRSKPAGSSKDKARTLDEIKDYFNSMTGKAEDPKVSEFAGHFLSFAAGKLSELQFDKVLKESLLG